MNKLKKFLALALTITSPIWIIPFMAFVVLSGIIMVSIVGITELYEDMKDIVGVKE